MLDCDEVLERLYYFLDRELSDAELAEVRSHLEACPPCRDRFTFEQNVLRRVGTCARKLNAPPSLVDKVRRMCDQ